MAIGLLLELRAQLATAETPIVISGNIGPRGDGYRPDARMSAAEAETYHGEQVRIFADTDADMVAAFTMNYPEEAMGVARAARAARMPLALSFTVETDGRLPSGDSLAEAIQRVEQDSAGHPAYYMINCAHPAHFEHAIEELGPLASRVRGLRANASRLSHAELDVCTTLDSGNPAELGAQYAQLKHKLPELRVVGGAAEQTTATLLTSPERSALSERARCSSQKDSRGSRERHRHRWAHRNGRSSSAPFSPTPRGS